MEKRFEIKLANIIKKNIFRNKFFYCAFFLLKFLGIILCSRNIRGFEKHSNNITISISSIFSHLTLFEQSFSLIQYYYQSICLFLFILFLIISIIIIYYLLLFKKIYKKNNIFELKTEKYLFNKKLHYLIIKIICYILLILLFFSQHIIEYLMFGTVSSFYENKIKNGKSDLNFSEKNQKYFNSYYDNLILNQRVIMIINILTIIIISCYCFLFILINDSKSLFSIEGVSLYSTNLINVLIIIISLFQSFYGFTNLYNEENRKKFRLFLNFAVFLISFLFILNNYKNYLFYFDSFVAKFIYFLFNFCFYSSIIESVIYFTIKEKSKINEKNVLFILFSEFACSYCLSSVLFKINVNFFEKNLIKNIFKIEEKKRHLGEIFIYIKYFIEYRNNSNNYHNLFSILNKHKNSCVLPNCICNEIFNRISENSIIHKEALSKEDYVIIGEQEIVNRIYYLFKFKKFTKEFDDLIILHVQYVYAIGKKYFFALYICSMYMNSQLKLSFRTRYFLYEIKKQIYNELKFKKKNNNHNIMYEKEKINEHYFNNIDNIEKYLEFKKFLNFSYFSQIIEQLIGENLLNLSLVLSFRKEMKKNSKLKNLNSKIFNKFLKSCKLVKNNDEKITKIIERYIIEKNNNKKIRNLELSYILTNYYLLIHKSIPNKLNHKFEIKKHYVSIQNLLEFDYSEFELYYPMILNLTKNDIFQITFINSILCEILNFSKEKIKFYNFNDLIPFDIKKEHNFLMKQFLFVPNCVFYKKNTFILDNNNYLISVDIKCKTLPSIYNVFNIIVDVKILEDENDYKIKYNLFLNKNFKISNISKNFEDLFLFDLKMFDILKINFCDFFGLNKMKLEKKIQHHFKKNKSMKNKFNEINKNKTISNTNKFTSNFDTNSYNYLDYTPIGEEDKALSIFNTIPNEKMFILRKEKTSIKQLIKKQYNYSDSIRKSDVIKSLSILYKTIEDIGLDIEWYNRVKCLGERLRFKCQNIFNKNQDKTDCFIIQFSLRQIITKFYYVVNMFEIGNIKEIYENNENLKNILLKNNLKNDFTLTNDSTKNNNNNNNLLNYSIDNKRSIKNRSSENIVNILDNSRGSLLNKNIFKKSSIQKKITYELEESLDKKILKKKSRFSNNNIFLLEKKDFNSTNNLNEGTLQTSNINISSTNALSSIIDPQNLNTNNNSSINALFTQNFDLLNSSNNKLNSNSNLIKFNVINNYSSNLTNDAIEKKLNPNYNPEKLNYIKKILFRIIILLYFIIILLCLIFVISKNSRIKTHQNLFDFNIYIEIVKTDIYLSSLDSLIACFSDPTYLNKFKSRADNFRDHMSYINEYIKTFTNNDKMKNVFQLLYEENSFDILLQNWEISKRNSNVLEEINLFQYTLNKNFYYENNSCNITNFYEQNFLNFYNTEMSNPQPLELLFFYTSYNILQKFKGIFEKIISDSINILLIYYKEFFSFIILYYIIINIVFLVSFIIMFYLLNSDKEEIKYLLKKLFFGIEVIIKTSNIEEKLNNNNINNKNNLNNPPENNKINNDLLSCEIKSKEELNLLREIVNDNQESFENQIYLLRKMIIDFNSNTINNYEDLNSVDIKNEFTTTLDAELTNEFVNNQLKKKKTKKRKKKLTKNDKNQKNKNQKNSNNNNNNNNKNKNNLENKEENFNPDDLNILLPNSIIISYILLFLFFALIVFITIVNVWYSYTSKNDFIFCIAIAMNFLERIPNALELIFYSEVSVIYNNITFIMSTYISKNIENKDEISYFESFLNYYEIKDSFKNNTQIYALIDSFYSNLFNEGKLVEENILKFLGDETNNLKSLKKWEILFNIDNKLCENAAYGSILENLDLLTDIFEFYETVNNNTSYCLKKSNKTNENGLQTEFNFIYQELSNIYSEFSKKHENNINDCVNFMNNTSLIRMEKDFDSIFINVFSTYKFNILNDIHDIYYVVKTNEIIISYFLLISLFIIAVINLLFITRNLNKYKELLMLFYKLY